MMKLGADDAVTSRKVVAEQERGRVRRPWIVVLYPDGWFEARPDCVLLGWQLRRNACKIEGIACHEQRRNLSRDIEQYAQDPDHNRHSLLRTADHSIQKNEDCRFFCVKLAVSLSANASL